MRTQSTKRTLASLLLAFEAVIIFFGTLVAFGLKFADGGTIWAVGLSLAAFTMVLPAWIAKPGGYVVGWLLQFTIVAISFWSASVNGVGGFFIFLSLVMLGMWIWAIIAGSTVDTARVAWEKANASSTVQNETDREIFRVEGENK